jgi:integrase
MEIHPSPYFILDPKSRRIRIRQNYPKKRIVISLDEKCNPKDWSASKGLPKDYHQRERLKLLLQKVEESADILSAKGFSNPSLQACFDQMKNPVDVGAPGKDDNRIASWAKFKAGLHNVNYRKGFITLQTHLSEWGRPNALLVDINETWVFAYCNYMQKRGMRTASISKMISYLRHTLKAAKRNKQPVGEIPDELTPGTLGGEPSKIRLPLNFGDLMRLHNLTGISKQQGIIRDLFLLQAFTGLRVGDLMNPNQMILKDRIINIQGKTSTAHVITLNEYSLNLIKKYSTINLDGSYQLNVPKFTPQYTNRYCILLGKIAGIKKHISNHIGRHSRARLLADIGLNEELRGAELGHKKSVTSRYGQLEGDLQVRIVQMKWEKAIKRWKEINQEVSEDQAYEKWMFEMMTA